MVTVLDGKGDSPSAEGICFVEVGDPYYAEGIPHAVFHGLERFKMQLTISFKKSVI